MNQQHMDEINALGYCGNPSSLANGSPQHLYTHQPALGYSSPSSCSTPYPLMYSDPSTAATPLTPAVSPSLYDSEHFNRKYSVDVGPFSFASNSSDLQNYLDRQDELFRRSSTCTDMSTNECMPGFPSGNYYIGDYASYMAPTDNIDHNNSSKSKTTYEQVCARIPGDVPAVQHKHVCKFSFCGWSFKRYEHLKRHMLVHTGERPHVCHYPGCGKSFSRSDNFHAHCRTHNKKNGFQGTGGRRVSRNKSTAAAAVTSVAPSLPSSANLKGRTVAQPGHRQHHQPRSMEFSAEPNYLDNFYEQQRSPYQLNDNVAAFPYMPLASTPMLNAESIFLTTTDAPDYVGSFNGDDSVMMNPWANLVANASPQSSSELTVTAEKHPTDPMPSNETAAATSTTSSPATGTPVQFKSHVCPVPLCQRRFKRLEHLKRHMRIHTLERPFSCTFLNCHKTFSRSDNLSQHMKTHQRHEDRRKRQQQQQHPHHQHHHHHHQDMTCSSIPSALSHDIASSSDNANWTVGMTSAVRC